MQYSSLPGHFVLADSVDLHESRFSVAYRLGLHRLLKHPPMGCTVQIQDHDERLLLHKAGQEGRGEILLENSFMR